MARKKAAESVKRPIAGRLQYIIERHAKTNTAFYKKLDESSSDLDSSTVRKWVPGPEVWKWDNERERWAVVSRRSKSDRAWDWEVVAIPNAEQLGHFCRFTGASADYILFGSPSPYLIQQRAPANLDADLAADLRRRIILRGTPIPAGEFDIRVSQLMEAAADIVEKEVQAWNTHRAITGVLEQLRRKHPAEAPALADQIRKLAPADSRFVWGWPLNTETTLGAARGEGWIPFE